VALQRPLLPVDLPPAADRIRRAGIRCQAWVPLRLRREGGLTRDFVDCHRFVVPDIGGPHGEFGAADLSQIFCGVCCHAPPDGVLEACFRSRDGVTALAIAVDLPVVALLFSRSPSLDDSQASQAGRLRYGFRLQVLESL